MGSELRRLSLILPEPTSAKDCPSAFRFVAPSLAGANACGALRELRTLGRRAGPPRQAARRGAVVGCGGPGAAFGTDRRRPCGRCQGRQGRQVLSTSRLRPVWQRCCCCFSPTSRCPLRRSADTAFRSDGARPERGLALRDDVNLGVDDSNHSGCSIDAGDGHADGGRDGDAGDH